MPAATKVVLSHAVAGGNSRPANACAATERRRPHFAGAPGKPMKWSVMWMAFDRHLSVIDDHNADERAMKRVRGRGGGRTLLCWGVSRCSAQGAPSFGATWRSPGPRRTLDNGLINLGVRGSGRRRQIASHLRAGTDGKERAFMWGGCATFAL